MVRYHIIQDRVALGNHRGAVDVPCRIVALDSSIDFAMAFAREAYAVRVREANAASSVTVTAFDSRRVHVPIVTIAKVRSTKE